MLAPRSYAGSQTPKREEVPNLHAVRLGNEHHHKLRLRKASDDAGETGKIPWKTRPSYDGGSGKTAAQSATS